ncbi:beta-N-acetylhexosaminidase [Vagococcus sp. PNs007]|uniref:Beta-N-acetylhexosaminidase n=1 Tax=Vagococcus proximus TaxID=2991417 RepID=A0ABT5X244_9ENTE|nr:beta-N-acetylhexosaminidase [Vagococcus proximus]MDF0480068.1 beta-N-acetylhexosaminidase [Vagococcus proximus]
MKLTLSGDTHLIQAGLTHLLKHLDCQLTDDGFPLTIIKRPGTLHIAKTKQEGFLSFEHTHQFFRGLRLWLDNAKETDIFDIEETQQFKTSGAMIDASRNAVPKVDTVKDFLNNMALMGLNMLMLYTEDTYEVPEYPLFGYLRGPYTKEEIQDLDRYALDLGIELVPCIQALGHLYNALQYRYAIGMKDTHDILLVDEPKTYEFLDNLFKSISDMYTTNRVHIGMDEAHDLGLGLYLNQNGYKNRFEIMNSHLRNVLNLTDKYQLKPMIWSDMYFRLGSKTDDYYDKETVIPKDIVKTMPDIQMVYWDYYHSEQEDYEYFLKKHQEFEKPLMFAGGIWTFNGMAPNYGKTWVTTNASLQACKLTNTEEVMATIWLDDGAETPLQTCLPGLQLFAEHTYKEKPSQEDIAKAFLSTTGDNLEDFLLLSKFDETPGIVKDNLMASHPSKISIWQDPLIGLYDKSFEPYPIRKHYTELAEQLGNVHSNNKDTQLIMDFYHQFAKAISLKSELGIDIQTAYTEKNKNKMSDLMKDIDELKQLVNNMHQHHREVWYTFNKAFGWEIIDIRYGGVLTRLDTASYRLKQWINGNIEELEELEVTKYIHDSTQDGYLGRNLYQHLVSPSKLSDV